MGYKLFFPTGLNEVNIINDNIDVCIELTSGKRYTIVVATPQNMQKLMEDAGIPYMKPGAPFLFVEKLTEYNIRLLVDELVQDPVLLHIYGEDLW